MADVRITGGNLKGSIIPTPGEGTHPAGSRMREGVFSALGEFDGLSVLDLYCGSGIFALESISRGAERATCVDISAKALDVVRNTSDKLSIAEKMTFVQADAEKYLDNHLGEDKLDFNVIFVDPPYPQFSWSIIVKLGKTLANKNALMVVSHPGVRHTETEIDGLVVVKEKTYGNAHVTYLKQKDK